ncbi:SAM-dependent methyltransferase [Synechococcus sp. UW179A]|uniref:SAM-dependent methyltransferase n=1 Tax=Synechococcus sp. UW179A TaxID=2575510 RepID=UPI001FCAD28D|nr:SAM-dependent methyltransferase [Synechococcus sp. UW179A]
MKALDVPCPEWLRERLQQHGQRVPFSTFMEWALHDPDHGAYGSGQLHVGTTGDFVTSPSLSEDFSSLLIHQLIEWLELLGVRHPEGRLSIVDVGPGEGDLIAQLIPLLQVSAAEWLPRLECVLVEINPGMQQRQRARLESVGQIPCRWVSLQELAAEPVNGIMIAHELLDALPVERLILKGGSLRRQMVTLQASGASKALLRWDDDPLPVPMQAQIQECADRDAFELPPRGALDGWATEWHHSVQPWMKQACAAMTDGLLLVVDYALESSRYYNSRRADGTLVAYKRQQASSDVLRDAGSQDITAHLCIESFVGAASEAGWNFAGQCRQGEALLALGLAARLTALQQMPADQLAEALRRREALLRLVDPSCLGELRWFAFLRNAPTAVSNELLDSRFLREPT